MSREGIGSDKKWKFTQGPAIFERFHLQTGLVKAGMARRERTYQNSLGDKMTNIAHAYLVSSEILGKPRCIGI